MKAITSAYVNEHYLSDPYQSCFLFKGDRVVEFLTRLFESTDSYAIQALLCKGLAKLMISGMVTDERVTKLYSLLHVEESL